jgi:hypothetical protein
MLLQGSRAPATRTRGRLGEAARISAAPLPPPGRQTYRGRLTPCAALPEPLDPASTVRIKARAARWRSVARA